MSLLLGRRSFVDPPESLASDNPYPVQPLGFLLGVLVAAVLYAVHATQVARYFRLYAQDDRKIKLLVCWVFTLSTLQTIINWSAAVHYFVKGIVEPRIWGEFWWPLSVQDGLVPTMALTAQVFYGRRVASLLGCRKTVNVALSIVVPLNWLLGIAMAILSYFWARDPFAADYHFRTATVKRAADIVPLVWLAISAVIDASLTLALMFHLVRLSTSFARTQRVIHRLMRLTLETVGLTHLVGATMAILFIVSRTRTDAFWFFLELITELYALSILFTLTSRASLRNDLAGPTTARVQQRQRDVPPPEAHQHDKRRELTFVDGPNGQLVARWADDIEKTPLPEESEPGLAVSMLPVQSMVPEQTKQERSRSSAKSSPLTSAEVAPTFGRSATDSSGSRSSQSTRDELNAVNS